MDLKTITVIIVAVVIWLGVLTAEINEIKSHIYTSPNEEGH